jgi:hypothetical protein
MDIVEVWRKSRLGRCACTQCHYCDCELDVHQHDHHPIPKRASGTQVVPTCLVCHDLKDRIPLRFWDMDAMHQAFDELLKDKIAELRHLPWPEALTTLDDLGRSRVGVPRCAPADLTCRLGGSNCSRVDHRACSSGCLH